MRRDRKNGGEPASESDLKKVEYESARTNDKNGQMQLGDRQSIHASRKIHFSGNRAQL